MPEPLPPVAAIRVFEAVCRHMSFTRAGAELGMTQAAVSYQIKVLEERLGAALFRRLPRRIELTEIGAQLAPRVTDAFSTLRDAFDGVRQAGQGTLTILCSSTFAIFWLSERLGGFQLENPGLAVRLIPYARSIESPGSELTAAETPSADVLITAGRRPKGSLRFHQLVPCRFTPMVSPGLAESIGGIHIPEDLLKLPIIDPHDAWWADWFHAAGVSCAGLADTPAARMGSQALEAQRAIAGQGVAILTPFFYRDALAKGQLIQPFDLECETDGGWTLSYPENRRNAGKIRAFRDWLLENISRDLKRTA
ncbi:LysR substrate-binding domain-containing protein [uncultured Roseibium sp.]|uniref:LysR substrate-binding domain-containing protein n=1 Tax=uncultured Roseibium sp. TaxID=1936171 RepID=UPI0032178011